LSAAIISVVDEHLGEVDPFGCEEAVPEELEVVVVVQVLPQTVEQVGLVELFLHLFPFEIFFLCQELIVFLRVCEVFCRFSFLLSRFLPGLFFRVLSIGVLEISEVVVDSRIFLFILLYMLFSLNEKVLLLSFLLCLLLLLFPVQFPKETVLFEDH